MPTLRDPNAGRIDKALRTCCWCLVAIGITGIAIVLLSDGFQIGLEIRIFQFKNPILFLAGGLLLATVNLFRKGQRIKTGICFILAMVALLLVGPAEEWRKSRSQASGVNSIVGKQQTVSAKELRRIGASRLDQTFGRKDLRGGSMVPFLPATPLIVQEDDTPVLHGSLAKQLAEQTEVGRVQADGALRTAVRLTPEQPLRAVVGPSENAVVRMGLVLKIANARGVPGASATVQISQTVASGKAVKRSFEVTTSKWSDVQMEIGPGGEEMEIDLHLIDNGHEENEVWISDPRVVPGNPEQARRLVLMYVIDALRADALSCYGYTNQTTGTMEELAAQGVVFEQFYAQSSWTRASVGSLLTGTYPVTHGAIERGDRLSPRVWSLARHLTEQGFYTAGFTTNGNISGRLGFERGFDEYVDLFQVRAIRSRRQRVDLKGVIPWAQDVTDYVIPWLERNTDRNLFVYIHTLDPHFPYTPPPLYANVDPGYKGPLDGTRRADIAARKRGYKPSPRDIRHLRALYDAEVKYADDELGRFVEHLRRLGFWDRMLLIVTADHGEQFMEHGGRGHGLSLFEEEIRVPLILLAPGRFPSGKRIWAIGEHVDCAPTICDFLDIPSPETLPGQSLIPVIAGQDGKTRHLFSHMRINSRHLVCARSRFLKLVWDEDIERGTLYHLGNDPTERRPIPRKAGQRGATRLWAYLQGWRAAFDIAKSLESAEELLLDPETVRQLEALGYGK